MDFAFLHGGGQGGWVWDETIAAMKAQSGDANRYLALDVPGCGTKRERDTASIQFDEIAPELIADIEAASMKDVILVGHSQAGMTLPPMAELRPDLFQRLVFLTCSAPLPGKTTVETMGNSLHGANENEVGWPVDPATTTIQERYRAMFCNDMSDSEADAFLAKLGNDMWPMCTYAQTEWRRDHLANLPVTYVLCLKDKSLTPEWQERFAKAFHADRIAHLDVGHQAMNTQPNALASLLLGETGV